jgi:hypothetical protein
MIWTALLNDDWQDQYLHLLFGQRVLHGQVPYRDFFCFWGPGSGYVIAAWFKLFGDSMEGVRILTALTGAAAVTAVYDISRMLISGPLRWIGPFGALSAFVIGNQGLGHVLFAMPLALVAIAVAIRADQSGNGRLWFGAGMFSAVSALFTQSLGAWVGVALFTTALSAQSSPWRVRLRNAAWVCLSVLVVAIPFFLLIVAAGAWEQMRYDVLVWPVERYIPYHAGVGWGAWLPQWSMLDLVPRMWWPVWISTLLIARIVLWILPLMAILAVVQILAGRTVFGRRVLILSCAAFYISALPNGEVWRVLRLSLPFWPLLALEMDQLGRVTIINDVLRARLSFVLLALSVALLLAGAAVQWSYRETLVTIETPRGRATVHSGTKYEFDTLVKHYSPNEEILTLPDLSPADYFFRLTRPLSNDHALVPVFLTPEQLRQYGDELGRKGIVRIAVMADHATNQQVINEFRPGKYLNEFNFNPLEDFVLKNYELQFIDGGMQGLVRKGQKNQ